MKQSQKKKFENPNAHKCAAKYCNKVVMLPHKYCSVTCAISAGKAKKYE